MSRLAIIPARGGSSRIPRKNIRMFHGKPIIAYSIQTAFASGLFDAGVWVSTDDPEIMRVAWDYKAMVHPRPQHLAQNHVGTQDVMAAVLRELYPNGKVRPEAACCIYATSPLLCPEDLLDGYRALKKRVARYAFSVGYPPLHDAGGYYWGLVGSFIENYPLVSQETVVVPLPLERICDINVEADWVRAERMYEELQITQGITHAAN